MKGGSMEGPDPLLSEIYGTAALSEVSPQDAAVEKIAAALGEQNIDFDALSDEEKNELVEAALAAEEGGEEATEEGAEEETEAGEAEESEKTSEAAKFAEADTMGRIMAHAFKQEQARLEKEAAASPEDLKKAKKMMGIKQRLQSLKRHGGVAARRAGAAVAGHVRSHPKSYGAAGALGAAGAGFAAGRMSKKSSASVLDSYIEARAAEQTAEILADLGVDASQLG
jgi:hypothetical protein